MELPFNTVYSKELMSRPGRTVESPVADWPTKRAWVDYAFDEMAAAGYEVSSAYTLVKDKSKINFVYRDSLWHGADMLAPAWPPSATPRACTIKTSPIGPAMSERLIAASCRWAAPCGRPRINCWFAR